MAQNFGEVDDPPMKNLFDKKDGTGVGGSAIRMAAGAPGPDLLRRCLPLFQAATKHRLVSSAYHLTQMSILPLHARARVVGFKKIYIRRLWVVQDTFTLALPRKVDEILWNLDNANYFTLALPREKEQEEANLFQYGSVPGYWEFREQLAKFLSHHYQDPVNKADLIMTCGATHGLHIVLSTLLTPGAIIFVEEATYMIALNVFKEFPQFPVVAVDIDENGLIVQDLEERAEQLKAAGVWKVTPDKPFWAMMYCIPVFHNPTGVTLSNERCESLVQLARRLDMLVFCDDVYNLLVHRVEPKPPSRVFAYDRPGATLHGGHVISNGTFSKILAPGTRVGWLEAPPRLVRRLLSSGILLSSGAVNQYMSGVVTSLLELGLQRDQLRFLANTLQGRMQAICTVLDNQLPAKCSFYRPRGGYYIWLQLPTGVDARTFADWSEREYKVTALPGGLFAARPGDFANCLRLSVAFHSQPTLEAATIRLCEAISVYLLTPQPLSNQE